MEILNKNKEERNIFQFLVNDFFFHPSNSFNKTRLNNNDTFQLVLFLITIIKNTLKHIYNITLFNLRRLNYSLNFLEFIFFIFLFLITFIYSEIIDEDDNSDIPDSIIYSAYFHNQKIIHITYESIANNKSFDNAFTESMDTIDIISDYKYEYKQNEKIGKNIYQSYGNNTIFKLYLEDLEKMVNSSIISERQAKLLWHILLNNKVEYCKNYYSNYLLIKKQEVYLFNFFPLKTGLFTCISFLILYIFILKTYTSRIRDSFIFNILGFLITFLVMNCLYENKYYSASGLLFIQLSYFLKCLIETFFLKAKISREDFEIFTSNLSANHFNQFISKFVILMCLTLTSGFLIFGIYRVWINYIIFYLSLFTLVIFISNCLCLLEPPSFLFPLKNLLIVILGLINFIISKFHKNIYHYKFNIFKEIKFNHYLRTLESLIPDSLYLVSDFFTLFCFHYLNDFLKTQMNKYLILPSHPNKKFTYDDCFWILGFIIGIGIGIIGMLKGEYMCYMISMYFVKIVMDIFSKVFNIKLVRIVNDSILLIYIFMNHIINNKGDNYLVDLFSSKEENRFIPKYICKILSLIQILCYMLMNFDYVYSQISDKNLDLENLDVSTKEVYTIATIKKNYHATFHLQLIKPEKQFSFKTFFFINLEFYLNYMGICLIFYIMKYSERSYMCLTILVFILILFFARKFFIIHELKKDYEYLFSYIYALIISMRLLVLTKNNFILKALCDINILCLILFYSLVDRRKNIITLLIYFQLYAGCLILNSNFLFFDLLSIICLLITFQFKTNNNSDYGFMDDESGDNGYSCVFIIPAFVFLSFQLYGLKNVFFWMNKINDCMKKILFGFDILNIFITLKESKNGIFLEIQIIKKIITFFLK